MFSIVGHVLCEGLFGVSQTRRLCAAGCLLGAIGAAQAQTEQALGGWQLSAGWQDYSEPQMNLKGPELGLHWQSRPLGAYTLEAEAHVGLQNYSSPQSGRLDSVLNLDTRWRALRALTSQPQWQFGLAVHTHTNFLRGTTNLGYGGYDRLSTQVWLPVRWQSLGDPRWTVDAGGLLWGEHESHLSQVNTSLQDVTNTQRKGAYVQIGQKRHTSRGELEPYARWTWVDDSDVRGVMVAGQVRGAYEPRHNRLQLGLKWRLP
jgi:hypothetical protein